MMYTTVWSYLFRGKKGREGETQVKKTEEEELKNDRLIAWGKAHDKNRSLSGQEKQENIINVYSTGWCG